MKKILAGLLCCCSFIGYASATITNDTKKVSDLNEVDNYSTDVDKVLDYQKQVIYDNIMRQFKDQREQIVRIALNEVGTREANNDNNIKYNDWYVPSHSWLDGNPYYGKPPYCAIFTLWCLDQIGMFVNGSTLPPSIDSASCVEEASAYKKLGRFMYAWSDSYTPRRGDLIFFTNWNSTDKLVGYHSYHTGIVIDCVGDTVYTVEGNTSSGGIEGVHTKEYKLPSKAGDGKVLGFAIPYYYGDEEFYSEDGLTF